MNLHVMGFKYCSSNHNVVIPMSKKILIVDDSALSRKLMKKILQQVSDCQLVEVSDSLVAFETILAELPDLVLLDLNMEGINGLELLTSIKQVQPNLKVMIASADIQKATIDEAIQKGALDYITKPFNDKEILTKVENALKNS